MKKRKFTERIRFKGKFIPKEYEIEFRDYAANAGINPTDTKRVQQWINEEENNKVLYSRLYEFNKSAGQTIHQIENLLDSAKEVYDKNGNLIDNRHNLKYQFSELKNLLNCNANYHDLYVVNLHFPVYIQGSKMLSKSALIIPFNLQSYLTTLKKDLQEQDEEKFLENFYKFADKNDITYFETEGIHKDKKEVLKQAEDYIKKINAKKSKRNKNKGG